jgi:hypothetical protein
MPEPHELDYYLPCANCTDKGGKHVDIKCLFDHTDFQSPDLHDLTADLLRDIRNELLSAANNDELIEQFQMRCPHRVEGTNRGGVPLCWACGAPMRRRAE